MRNIILLLMMVSAMATTAQTSDKHKKAVLLVHYGTNNDQSRAKTIDVINQKMAEAMPQTVVCEAYSSKMVIASLKKRGIQKNTISEALRQLYAKGCTDIIIQSTHLLPGVMQEIIEKEADKVRFLFDTIQVNKPLLWNADDACQLASLLAKHINAKKDEQVVLVGHGTPGPANAMYTLLNYALHEQGFTNYHVATIEGYPTLAHVKKMLQENKKPKVKKAKHVILYPLLYIAGNHATEDIEGEWKQELEKEGYKVSFIGEGIGELPEIQQWIINKTK